MTITTNYITSNITININIENIHSPKFGQRTLPPPPFPSFLFPVRATTYESESGP